MMAQRAVTKSEAYEAGRRALASAAARLGTVNLSPSIAQREEWGYAWAQFMAGWNAEKKRPNPWPFSRPDARRTTPASGGIAYHTSKRKPATVKKAAAAVAGKKGGAFSVPDEGTIQEGFKRGLSLREILGNPGVRRCNPSDESVQEKSWREWQENFNRVTRDPESATTKDLRRALGYLVESRSSMIRRAQAKGIPVDGNILAGFDNEYEYLKSLMLKRERGNPSKFDRCVKAVQAKGGAANAYAVCTAAGTRNPGGYSYHGVSTDAATAAKWKAAVSRGHCPWCDRVLISKAYGNVNKHLRACPKRPKANPAGAAAEAFEKFHGFEPSEVITVTKRIFHHEHLAAAGELPFLKVWGIDERGHTIDHFKGTILAFNETMNQLFAEAGDQRINLKDFGITKPHELETLGRIVDIGYATNKTHLGSEGGKAVYVHKFRTTNDGGKHVVVKIARYPDLIYDVRNEQLLFSGGSYEILREGIDK